MAKVLTQAALDALKHMDKRQEIPDAKVAGLYRSRPSADHGRIDIVSSAHPRN
jgi:hypothetical protein